MKKICRLAMVLGTVAVFGFLGCTALTGNNKSGTTQSGTEGNTGGNENGNNTGENNQTQTVDLSTALSSFTEDEITALEESINTQILSSTNGVTGITATIDADKNLSLTYGGNASVAITPVLTDDGAIKLLETYANKSTVIAAKKTELKNTADNFAIPNELAQKLGENAADLKTSIKTVIENIPTEKFAYSLGNRAIYFKISDLDSSKLPAVSTQTPNAEIIPGVKRILRNGRTAIDFTGLNAEIKIDFENENKDVSNFYRGGIIYNNNNNISLLRDNAKFAYTKINKQDFNNKGTDLSLLDVNSVNFSELIFSVSDNNIYGAGINNIITKYLTNDQEDKITIMTGIDNTTAIKYDAKEVVDKTQSKRMFDDNNNLNPALESNTDITIDAEFASLLLSKGVSVKNVVIDNTKAWPDSRKSELGGTLVNSVVKTSMEKVEGLKVKGLVRFEQKSPKTLSGNQYSKVIFKDENTWNDELVAPGKSTSNYPFLDISSLLNKQEEIATKLGFVYLSEDKVNTVNNSLAASLLFGEKYYKRGNYDYDNASRETYGNDGTIPTTVRNRTKVEDGATVPLSRVNNIKLTPVQKLLLDDQHIYG